jgi:hypothetical protein
MAFPLPNRIETCSDGLQTYRPQRPLELQWDTLELRGRIYWTLCQSRDLVVSPCPGSATELPFRDYPLHYSWRSLANSYVSKSSDKCEIWAERGALLKCHVVYGFPPLPALT